MKPRFRIEADGADLTAQIADRLVSLRLNDEDGLQSDTAELVLDDREGALRLPSTGAELDIALGYESEAKLTRMGLFVVDEITLASPPRRLSIRANAADMRQAAKAPRDRTWEATSLGEIGRTLAGEHGLEAAIAPAADAVWQMVWTQTAESDWSFLRHRSRQAGLVAKVASGRLILAERGKARGVSGISLPEVALLESDMTSWSWSARDRGHFGSVTAVWHDIEAGDDQPLTVGDGEPVYYLRSQFADEASAKRGAQAKLDAFNRSASSLRLELPGRVDVFSGSPVQVSGLSPDIDAAKWVALRVRHRLGSDGWSLELDCETASV